MDKKNIEQIKNILSTSDGEQGASDIQGFHIHRINDGHLLKGLGDIKEWTLPCLLASAQLQCRQTDDLTDVGSSCQEETQESRQNESLEGSPLKLQEFQTENFMTAPVSTSNGPVSVFKPLSIDEARLILSLYCVASDDVLQSYIVREDAESLPPLWTLCDAKDQERTVVMGTHIKQQKQKKHITTTTVCVQGPVHQDSKLLWQLWAKRPGFCRSGKALTTRCFAKYNIHGAVGNNETLAPPGHQGSLEIHFHWSRMSSLLQTPPVEAKAVVKATAAVGDSRSAAHLMFVELSVLKGLVDSLDTGLAQWASTADMAVPLLIRVKNLVKGLEGGATFVEAHDEKNHDSSVFLNAANNAFVVQREELDFTEQLWNILKDCTSFQDLVECLQYVLSCLSKGDLQPVVHRDNKSTLAQLIRDSYYNQMSPPDLDGAVPLELLVEIGLEKMCNDYTNAFLTKELVTSDSLDKFVLPEGRPSERMGNLGKLHHALELIAMLETLSLPKMTLSISARQALKHYETATPDVPHTFTIPVHTTDVKTMIERYQPSVWRAEISGDHSGGDVRSVYSFSERPPFDHVYLTAEETLQDDTQPYYVTILTEDSLVL